MSESGDLEALLVAQVRAKHAGLRAAAVLLFVICVGGGLLAAFAFDTTERSPARAVAGGVVGTVLALILFAITLRNPRRHAAIDLLLTRPGTIVWHYIVMPPRPAWTSAGWARAIPGIVADSTLTLAVEDGTRVTFAVSAGNEDAIAEAVARTAPAAARGYSPEREAQFRKAPTSLRRS